MKAILGFGIFSSKQQDTLLGFSAGNGHAQICVIQRSPPWLLCARSGGAGGREKHGFREANEAATLGWGHFEVSRDRLRRGKEKEARWKKSQVEMLSRSYLGMKLRGEYRSVSCASMVLLIPYCPLSSSLRHMVGHLVE